MAEINITKISSKGQVVIPLEMRQGLKEGDKLIIIRNDNQIILKKASDFDEQLQEDLEFAKRTEEAYKRIEQGDFIKMDEKDFLKELKKW